VRKRVVEFLTNESTTCVKGGSKGTYILFLMAEKRASVALNTGITAFRSISDANAEREFSRNRRRLSPIFLVVRQKLSREWPENISGENPGVV